MCRLQDQLDNVRREQPDMWREILSAARRDAPMEQCDVCRSGESAQAHSNRGWASNREELFTGYEPRYDEVARRGGGY